MDNKIFLQEYQIEDEIKKGINNVNKNRKIVKSAIFHSVKSELLNNLSPQVKGFSYLFLSYWMELFNNITGDKSYKGITDVGPKHFLPVMLRIPFSVLYEKGLDSTEKKEFQNFFKDIIAKYGKLFRLRSYRIYNEEHRKTMKSLTLEEWYKSITNSKPITFLQEKNGNEKVVVKQVDLLSPPVLGVGQRSKPYPILKTPAYAMGAYTHWNLPEALVEIRGCISFKGKNDQNPSLKIDNFSNFIETEAEWFFAL